MALSVPERIAQVAEHIAAHDAHGYSQPNREGDGTTETLVLSDGSRVTVHGGDYDCSEMVRTCVDCALSGSSTSPIGYMWTGNEDAELTAHGFVRMSYSASKVQRGDVLWVKGHTGVALGNGLQADAHGDEVGGITGPRRGDQTGHEVEVRSLRSWTYIYRCATGGSAEPTVVAASFTVTAGTERNVRSVPSTASGTTITGTLKPGESVVCRGLVYADGLAWGVYDNWAGRTRYIALQGSVSLS
jgi:hypothetical protein